MKALIFVPVAITIVLAFVLQLSDIAISTSDKTLNYADQMDSAVDCAFRGIPIQKCSPDLTNVDFEPELKEIINFNKLLIEEYNLNLSELTDK
jgi:hypothetical protein